jgi:BirA family transcriptional regulator, biotin operon repressor / biotin---[acetyl-CoA-carboxylase] ligase
MKSKNYQNYRILSFDELKSTNSEAKNMAQNGQAQENDVIICDIQTNGRGRMTRKWVSEKGSLYFSLVLKPEIDIKKLQQLTFLTVNSLKEAILELFADQGDQEMPKISKKWPNDLLIDDKKVAGILIESQINQEKCDFVIIGVGVNIASNPENTMFAASNLANFDLKTDSQQLLHKILDKFTANYQNWLNYGFQSTRNKWLEDAWKLNQQININCDDKKITGIFKDIDEGGNILIDEGEGLIKLSVGDVS